MIGQKTIRGRLKRRQDSSKGQKKRYDWTKNDPWKTKKRQDLSKGQKKRYDWTKNDPWKTKKKAGFVQSAVKKV